MTQEQKNELNVLLEKVKELENSNKYSTFCVWSRNGFLDINDLRRLFYDDEDNNFQYGKHFREKEFSDDDVLNWHSKDCELHPGHSEYFIDTGMIYSHIEDTLKGYESIAECDSYIFLYKLLEYFNLNTDLFDEEIYG